MRALLFDLDDTLLANSMDTFVPAYFDGLSRWAADHVAGDLLIGELRRLTSPQPGGVEAVDWAFSQGFKVVIATNPVFPRSAVEERLDWAGIPVTTYAYTLVTTYENMHATKSHPAYYREILEVLQYPAGECLMVGDSFWGDVAQAARVGIPGYWIAEPGVKAPDPAVPMVGRGRLTDCLAWLQRHRGQPPPLSS